MNAEKTTTENTEEPKRRGPNLRRSALKFKIKSLAAESYIAKLDEAKYQRLVKRYAASRARAADNNRARHADMQHHRRRVIAPEARASQLAYGFHRGLPYSAMEQRIYTMPDFDRVENIAKRFSDDDWRIAGQRWAEWRDAAMSAATASHAATAEKAITRRIMSRATALWRSTAEGKADALARKAEWQKEVTAALS